LELAPIVLFVYNRLSHTQRTIESLQRNELSKDTDLYIYSDAAKNKNNIEFVECVREYIKNIKIFKSVVIVEQEINIGLANSIISGVTNVINKHGKVIVMEDDLVVSEHFLKFMNNSLNYYEDKKDVWHISGWNYPISLETSKDVYFYRVMDCWGWATWNNRWKYFEKDTKTLINSMSSEDIYRFNLDGCTDLWRQVELNKSGRIDTWAIFWYATIFNHNGLCLNPVRSYVMNIGNDGTGIHCTKSSQYGDMTLNSNKKLVFERDIIENDLIVSQVQKFFEDTKRSLFVRIIGRLHSMIIKQIL
jgi:hypothetical protein